MSVFTDLYVSNFERQFYWKIQWLSNKGTLKLWNRDVIIWKGEGKKKEELVWSCPIPRILSFIRFSTGCKRATDDGRRRVCTSRDPAIIRGWVTCTVLLSLTAKWNYSTWTPTADRGVGVTYPVSSHNTFSTINSEDLIRPNQGDVFFPVILHLIFIPLRKIFYYNSYRKKNIKLLLLLFT